MNYSFKARFKGHSALVREARCSKTATKALTKRQLFFTATRGHNDLVSVWEVTNSSLFSAGE
jgi:hypothetical protein